MYLLNHAPVVVALFAVLFGMVTMFVWWLPVVIVSGTGALYWLLALRAESIGAHLSAAGSRAASRREAELHEVDWDRTIERDYRNLPGFGDVRGFFRLSEMCTRIVMGSVGLEMDNPRETRWWAARLLIIGGVFGTLGLASELGASAPALPLLFALGATAAAVAYGGPRPQVVAE